MDALDPLFVALSRIGSLALVWLVLAVVGAVVWRRPSVLAWVVIAVFSSDLIALVLKRITDRPRPSVTYAEPEALVRTPLDHSFPSGHAATSFAAATLFARFDRRAAVPLFALAAAIAWSRVYVGVHYPLDVLGGAVLGVLVGTLVAHAARPRARPRATAEP